jgi:hypothetical protein
MRKVTLRAGGWESILEPEKEGKFRGHLRDMDELRKIRFSRCVIPLEGQFKRPLQMVLGEGSWEACCSLACSTFDGRETMAMCYR